jgi:hypothetical protein
VQPFDGERHAKALGRVNWLHGQYNISNDDLLYTLSVFISAPERWLIKYDWRCLTELELTVTFDMTTNKRHGGLYGEKLDSK